MAFGESIIMFYDRMLKKEWQNKLFQKVTFFENVSRSKVRYKKTMRFTQRIVQVGMMLWEKLLENVQYRG